MILLLFILVVVSILGICFKIALNKLIVFWFIYLIRRDNGKQGDPVIALGFMRGLSYPWYHGKGLQVRIGSQVLQIGVCRTNKHHEDDTSGVLGAVGGRYLDEPVEQIREW